MCENEEGQNAKIKWNKKNHMKKKRKEKYAQDHQTRLGDENLQHLL